MKWWQISAILCTFGFLKEFWPAGPFLTPFLTTYKNLTVQQINEEMFPVHIYSHLITLVLVFLLTDFLRYKPMLIIGSFSGVTVLSFIAWGENLVTYAGIAEVAFGLYLSSEVAYFTYIYAKVDKQHYQKVTSHTRAASLLGRAFSSISSQILVLLNFNYLELNYFSIAGVICTIPLTLCLPSVPRSLYFHRETTNKNVKTDSSAYLKPDNEALKRVPVCSTEIFKIAFKRIYVDFRDAFTNMYVLRWSLWWAIATCGYLQVTAYMQLIWQEIIGDIKIELYHGYVEFVGALLGSIVSFSVGYVNLPWHIYGEACLGIVTLAQGCLVICLANLHNLYISYVINIVFKIMYEAGITISTYQIARFINEDSYALVLGVNNFVALIGQTLLTAIIIDALRLYIRLQYVLYSYYFFTMGSGFLVYGIYRVFSQK